MAESELSILEVTGTRRRRLVLRGSGLPHMGAEWGASLTVKTTWYDGNPRGSQQVLGPSELPSAWSGTWRRTMMGRRPSAYAEGDGAETQVVSPDRCWAAMDLLRASGHLLRVTWSATRPWDNELVQVTREGRLTELRVQVERVGDMAWSCVFTWLGRDAGARNVEDTSVAAIDDLGADALESRLDSMVAAYQDAQMAATLNAARGASALTLGKLESMASAPDRAARDLFQRLRVVTSGVRQAGEIARKVRASPASVRARAVDYARNGQYVVAQFVQDMGRRPIEADVLDTKVSALFDANARFDGVAEAAVDYARSARLTQRRLTAASGGGAGNGETSTRGTAAPAEGAVLALHVVADGDTATGLSRRYYRTPDHSDDLLRANGLPWHQVDLPVGATLVIPALVAPVEG